MPPDGYPGVPGGRQRDGVREGPDRVRFRELSLVAEWRRDRVGKD